MLRVQGAACIIELATFKLSYIECAAFVVTFPNHENQNESRIENA